MLLYQCLANIISLNIDIRKGERYKINNLSFYFRTKKKDQWIKVNRRKVIKINAEINETENSKKQKISKTKPHALNIDTNL